MHPIPGPLAAAAEDVLAAHRPAEVARAARALSERYLADRPAREPIMDSDLRAAAYVLTRMPATFAAARFALDQVIEAVPDLHPRQIVDLGAGTGAMSWAAVDAFAGIERVRVVDYSAAALALARRMLAPSGAAVEHVVARLDRGDAGGDGRGAGGARADLALAGYVLGELDTAGRDAVVDRLLRSADTVVVLEPGTPAGYARVLRVRDQMLEAGMRIAAPCPHEQTCPLTDGDWCHAATRLVRSSAHRQAKGGSRDFEDEKFAYVAATRLAVQPPGARVLRHPQVRPGHVQLELCADDGTARALTVTKRDKAAFRAARKVAWGEGWN
ncbi:small ribosomal subunit Rsm22 family protein [Ruania alba]|uniref:Ribosomal protein RSM22 (Predicted rRNA methylase) n=1 Tax=Ruania alba TaxID=648782 RepID=A0A1H5KVQ1_9MICO|nr:small ribosomal subunit Rsm22 family protein [Ruania alba]SEE68181.1 Ribosomal protein RSM22 (predicted rRNA methylase) [Ruania alba]